LGVVLAIAASRERGGVERAAARETHLFRICQFIFHAVVTSFFCVSCEGGWILGDASGGSFLQYASPEVARAKLATVVSIGSIWVSQERKPLKMSGRLFKINQLTGKPLKNARFSRHGPRGIGLRPFASNMHGTGKNHKLICGWGSFRKARPKDRSCFVPGCLEMPRANAGANPFLI